MTRSPSQLRFESASLWAAPCSISVESSREALRAGLGGAAEVTHLIHTPYGTTACTLAPSHGAFAVR